MNERIRELWDQAEEEVKAEYEDESRRNRRLYNEIFLPKFAELIVQECAEQIVAKGTDWVDFAPSQTGVRPEYWDMAQQIKKTFRS